MTEIIIATIMRAQGETGVQTHFNSFSQYLTQQQLKHRLVTPFQAVKLLVYPIFAVRKLLHPLSGELSVWWYRYWHQFFLQQVLANQLKTGLDCIIYAQCPLSAAAALKARVSGRQKVIMVTHFNISQADEWHGKGLISEHSQLYKHIVDFEVETLPKLDGVVFVSDFMRQELYQRIPSLKRVEATIIPNFLIDPGEPKNVMIKADLINIGSLEQRKNQSYLLEIIAALRDLGTTLTLTIIGDGPDRAKLEEKCKALHLNELVTFSGFVEKASEHIIYHRACIHVATIENLPMTLIESLAHGKPIFAAPVGGIREILLDGKVGINLPLDDAKNAAHLIINAIKSTDWMNEAAIAARQCFLNDYVADISANRLLKFLLQQLEAL